MVQKSMTLNIEVISLIFLFVFGRMFARLNEIAMCNVSLKNEWKKITKS